MSLIKTVKNFLADTSILADTGADWLFMFVMPLCFIVLVVHLRKIIKLLEEITQNDSSVFRDN